MKPALTTIPMFTAQPRRWWLWPNLLSLDAPLIALVWQEGFARSLGVELEWKHRALLGLCAWLAYCGDRILDGRRLKKPVESARHEFCRVHYRPLSIAWGVGLLVAIYLALQLSAGELLGGMVLLSSVLVYFGLHHHPATRQRAGCIKECMAGTGFAVGTVFFVLMQAEVSAGLIILCVAWAGLCSVNCLMIAGWDRDLDKRMDQPSMALVWHGMETRVPWMVIAMLGVSLGAVWLDQRWMMLSAALWVSGVGLIQLCLRRSSYPPMLARVLADAVLLSPLIFLV